jgi:hypothetical protein
MQGKPLIQIHGPALPRSILTIPSIWADNFIHKTTTSNMNSVLKVGGDMRTGNGRIDGHHGIMLKRHPDA